VFPGVARQVHKRHLAQISVGQWAAAGVRASRRAAMARNIAMAPIWIFLVLPWP
jgi:hypothetical protein